MDMHILGSYMKDISFISNRLISYQIHNTSSSAFSHSYIVPRIGACTSLVYHLHYSCSTYLQYNPLPSSLTSLRFTLDSCLCFSDHISLLPRPENYHIFNISKSRDKPTFPFTKAINPAYLKLLFLLNHIPTVYVGQVFRFLSRFR